MPNKIISLSFLLALFLSGCDLGPSNVESGTNNQILHLGNGTEPKDLDPHSVTGVPEHNIISALFEGLVTVNPKTLAPEPGTAASWAIDNDGKRYTFSIRDNAQWSNGDPVTADDFVWSWKRMLSPAMASEYAYQLFTVKNAKQFNHGEIKDFNQVGVKALNAKTLQVDLENPTPYFLSLLSHYSTYAVHPPTILKFGAIDEAGTLWTRPGNFVGNGPFVLDDWRLNYIIRVSKNPRYWDSSNVQLNEIVFYPIDQVQTEERMFKTGALHATSSIPVDKIAVYQQKDPEKISIDPYLGTYYYRINVNIKPLDDPKVRRALSMAIDREMLVSSITKGGQLPAYTFTPPNTQGYYAATSPITFDIEAARQLLTEAGYPNGEGFPEIELTYNTSDGHRRIAVAIQQMWKEALNINIRLSNKDWKVYLSRIQSMDYSIARAAWIGDYPDPNTFLDMFITDGGNNQTGWSNAEYDRLIALAASQSNQQQRYRTFQQAEALLMAESPIIPVYTYTRVLLKHPQLQGWYPNILDQHPYKYVYLQEPK
ncbi:MAG: peptide ABC transporter substrate-binding protein [Pseudomonadales bacterium]|nr:peptide ABC transporter substrate-binding protein [Pseudomonadales bacterium]